MTEGKTAAIAKNFEAFESLLPQLLPTASGKFALLRNQQLVGVFESAGDAHAAGMREFEDRLFSVQKIEKGAVSLGFFSYARYCRPA